MDATYATPKPASSQTDGNSHPPPRFAPSIAAKRRKKHKKRWKNE
jgi:hypothetical protein